MASNREISRLFNTYAELLHLHNQRERLADFLSGASYRLRNLSEDVSALDKAQLGKIFRPETAKIINELNQTGAIEDLNELIQLTPTGLFEMMQVRGLGGKKLSVLWRRAKIDTLEGLLKACKNNKIAGIPGFGIKTEANIIKAIEAMNDNRDRFYFADVAEAAMSLVAVLEKTCQTSKISLCGEIRRQTTTVAAIEIIAAVTPKKLSVPILRRHFIITDSNKTITRGHTLDEVPVIIYHTTAAQFYKELFERTGVPPHVAKIYKKIKAPGKAGFKSEAAIYKLAELPFIAPEMREDLAEWDFVKQKAALITNEDIRGVVHNHTTWSDGVDSLDNFVRACKRKGYEYTVISDHSKNAHYAGGLKEEKVLRQFTAIDTLNDQLKPFKIFKSIECDILVSGELDYDKSLLKKFDLVIVSVHQLLKMNEEKATRRLIKAIENPYTSILGHMTGRQLLIRPGYPVDFKKVIDACAANAVVIEINANPYRLDMDWTHIPYALKKAVMISINPDAHSIAEIDNIRWGVSAARKAGLTKQMTWNAQPLKKIQQWLDKKR
jgi:DNA polymerase (family 10)